MKDQQTALIIQQNQQQPATNTAEHSAESCKRSRNSAADASMLKQNETEISENASRPCSNELTKIVERLKREQVPSETSPVMSGVECVLQLEHVPNSTQAVYQTLKRKESDDIKREVDEVHNMMLKNNATVLGPDGKALSPHKYRPNDDSVVGENELLKSTLECKMSEKFQCEKCK